MKRDSELQRRISALEAQLASAQHAMREGPWSERSMRQADMIRIHRRIAMLTEDERRPTFAKPAEFGRADDYTAWRKEQGL